MFFPLLSLLLLTLGSLLVFLYTIFSTSPKTADGGLIIVNLIYFFASSFICLAAASTLVLYSLSSLRERSLKRGSIETLHRPKLLLKRSLRQGLLIAIALVGVGILNSLKFSNPLNIILFLSAVVIIEIYFFGH